MTSWFDYLLDARKLKAIYGQQVPSLMRVEFHGLDLHRDGPKALLTFDVAYPNQPPQKWVAAGFNRVQLRLLAFGIRDFKMSGLQRSCKLDIKFAKEDKLIHLLAEGSGMSLSLFAEYLLVDDISAYRDE